MKVSRLARDYFGGLAHVHTVLSNHKDHRESNLTIDRIVASLTKSGLVTGDEAPLGYVLLNEHPSDPAHPRLLGRLSLRGRRLLRQRRRPVVNRMPVLYGLEVSILTGGRTDLTPRLADNCPLVIASAHQLASGTQRNPAAIGELFKAACANPAVEVLGHPARFIEDLDEINWPDIFACARRTGTAVEVNFNNFPRATDRPWRRAFWRRWLQELADSGAWIFIGTDIHNQLQLDGFISQWHELDETAGHNENQLARFVEALHRAKIKPERVITADSDQLLDWLALDKAQRSRA